MYKQVQLCNFQTTMFDKDHTCKSTKSNARFCLLVWICSSCDRVLMSVQWSKFNVLIGVTQINSGPREDAVSRLATAANHSMLLQGGQD